MRGQKLISVCRAPFKPLFHVDFWGVVQLVCGSLESLNQAWSNPDKCWCQHHPTHQWGRRLAQWTLGGAKSTWQQRLMVKRIPWTVFKTSKTGAPGKCERIIVTHMYYIKCAMLRSSEYLPAFRLGNFKAKVWSKIWAKKASTHPSTMVSPSTQG